MKKYDTRYVKTVGALIKQLEKLPKSAKLSEPVRPVYCNIGDTAKDLGLKPVVDIESKWD